MLNIYIHTCENNIKVVFEGDRVWLIQFWILKFQVDLGYITFLWAVSIYYKGFWF